MARARRVRSGWNLAAGEADGEQEGTLLYMIDLMVSNRVGDAGLPEGILALRDALADPTLTPAGSSTDRAGPESTL